MGLVEDTLTKKEDKIPLISKLVKTSILGLDHTDLLLISDIMTEMCTQVKQAQSATWFLVKIQDCQKSELMIILIII